MRWGLQVSFQGCSAHSLGLHRRGSSLGCSGLNLWFICGFPTLEVRPWLSLPVRSVCPLGPAGGNVPLCCPPAEPCCDMLSECPSLGEGQSLERVESREGGAIGTPGSPACSSCPDKGWTQVASRLLCAGSRPFMPWAPGASLPSPLPVL